MYAQSSMESKRIPILEKAKRHWIKQAFEKKLPDNIDNCLFPKILSYNLSDQQITGDDSFRSFSEHPFKKYWTNPYGGLIRKKNFQYGLTRKPLHYHIFYSAHHFLLLFL